MLISRLASLLCRWNTDDMVLAMLSFRRQFSRYVDRMVISAVRPPSISSQDFFWSRIARSSAYPYFLACVTGRSCMYTLNSIGANTDPWGTPFLSLLIFILDFLCASNSPSFLSTSSDIVSSANNAHPQLNQLNQIGRDSVRIRGAAPLKW